MLSTRPGTVVFEVFDWREHTLLHPPEERLKRSLINLSCREVLTAHRSKGNFYKSSSRHIGQCAQTVVQMSRNHPCERRHRQRPAFVAGRAVLLFAGGLALHSCNFACQLLETLGHCRILQTRHQLQRRTPVHGFLARTHSRRALGRTRVIWALFINLHGTSCVTCSCTITSWNPLHLRHTQGGGSPHVRDAREP